MQPVTPRFSGPSRYMALKEKQRRLRDGFPASLGLRVHRAISWLGRAEFEDDDDDVRFILLWIGFNSVYSGDPSGEILSDRGAFKVYFDTVVALDSRQRIYDGVWDRFPYAIKLLLENKYVFGPFWNHANGREGYAGWAQSLAASRTAIKIAVENRDTTRILSIVFDRLYTLRNQLIHGGATWDSATNRNQVRDGVVPSRRWLELADAISSFMKLSDHAARSMG
jgi:hypothetical protein